MTDSLIFELEGQHLCLLPQKAVYWIEEKMLLLADVHLGKADHFRKAGIPIPDGIAQHNLLLLNVMVEKLQPASICFLGDLFHSRINKEWDEFVSWKDRFAELKVTLIRGNHDIIPAAIYKKAGISVCLKYMEQGPFIFSHEPIEQGISGRYALSGHLHPAVRLQGKGKQLVNLPCFYFSKGQALLPAFGQFTGTSILQPQPGDKVFVVTGKEVISVSR